MRSNKTVLALAVIVAIWAMATPVNAEILIDATLNNGSFESPTVGPSNMDWYSSGWDVYGKDVAPTGWSEAVAVQTVGSHVPLLLSGATGNQYLSLDNYGGGTTESITLSNVYQANTQYTLTADIAADAYCTYRCTFSAGGNMVVKGSAIGTTSEMQPMAAFVLDTAVNTEFVGQAVTVGVAFLTGSQLYVDNVGLTAVANVPEPGTFVLVATGLIGLLAYAWRKRK